jgi:hypothetical protein
MRGNLAHGRMTKFMPADFKLIEAREPPRIGSRTKHEHFLDRLLARCPPEQTFMI